LRNPLFGRAVVHEAAPGLTRSKPTAAARPATTLMAIGSERPWRLHANGSSYKLIRAPLRDRQIDYLATSLGAYNSAEFAKLSGKIGNLDPKSSKLVS
jgi:hypothetical protein